MCPFFVHGQATFARGVGEQFLPATPKESWYLVVHPQVHVSTAEIFQHSDLPRSTAKLPEPTRHCSDLAWLELHNDCEKLVCSLNPQVASALEWLLKIRSVQIDGDRSLRVCCFLHPTASGASFARASGAVSGVCRPRSESLTCSRGSSASASVGVTRWPAPPRDNIRKPRYLS